MKRTLGTIAVASALSVVLFACSSSHNDEPQGTTSSDLLLKCAPGHEECTDETGHLLCYCVEPTPVCSGVPQLALDHYVAAWAVVPFDGTCAPIRGTGGYWANIWTVTPPAGVSVFNGVPTDTAATSPSCTSVYPTGTCCTYVWWPSNLATSSTPYVQDNSVVCTQDTAHMQAIIEDGQTECPPPLDDGGCHGGTTCSSCMGNWP
jgi:hypothetical protein